MYFSLNEIDVQCRKAARGAGFEWGHAEESGKAIRWLAMYDLPGVNALARYLSELEMQSNKNEMVCPILKAAYLCDRSSIDLPATTAIENLAYPLLLLPYLAFIASKKQKTVSFQYHATSFNFGDNQLSVNVESSSPCDSTRTVLLSFSSDPVIANRKINFEQDVDENDWQILNQFASRTYVPASEISRQGAGSDEDKTR